MFAGFGGADAARLARRIVHDPQAIERGERELLAVRGQARIADLLRADRPFVQRVFEVHLRSELLLDPGVERNRRRFARGHVDAPDAAVERGDERFRVRRERRSRHQVARRRGLLIVAGDRIDQPRVVTALQIAHAESGLRVPARRVDEPAAVGRQHRPHRAAQLVAHPEVLAGLAVVHAELPAERSSGCRRCRPPYAPCSRRSDRPCRTPAPSGLS